jgi:uncharacterized protein YPO0396
MTDEPHVELDIPAIAARIKRVEPDNAQLERDVDLLVRKYNDAVEHCREQRADVQQKLSAIAEEFAERLGRLQRTGKPDSNHRTTT